MEEQIRQGYDFQTYFNPKLYLSTFYQQIEQHPFPEFQKYLIFLLDTLNTIYSSGEVKGHRLLDIGTGPSLHTIIPAVEQFEEIILTDVCQLNREMQEKWLQKDTEAHDWTPFFKFFSKLDGNESDWLKKEEDLRNKIKRILPCDVHHTNPMAETEYKDLDVISTCQCLEAACKTLDEYQKAMKNMTSLLRQGGKLVFAELLNGAIYPVGNEIFKDMTVTKYDVLDAMKNAGLKILKTYEHKSDEAIDNSPGGAIIILAEMI